MPLKPNRIRRSSGSARRRTRSRAEIGIPGVQKSALHRVLVVEGRARFNRDLVLIEALDRGDVGAAAGDGKGQARADRLAIEEKRAGPADPVLASEMRSG